MESSQFEQCLKGQEKSKELAKFRSRLEWKIQLSHIMYHTKKYQTQELFKDVMELFLE